MTDTTILTPRQEELLKDHSKKWSELSLRTTRQTAEERLRFIADMQALYGGVGLPELSPTRVFFARSPLEGRIMAGLLAAAFRMFSKKNWNDKKLNKLIDFVVDLPRAEPDQSLWALNPYDMAAINNKGGLGQLGAQYIQHAYRMWHSGGMSASSEAFIDFLVNVMGEPVTQGIPAWSHWRDSLFSGGGRFMHESFVVCCDFPTILSFDDRNRPHNDTGPHAAWSDGVAIYYIHGVMMPAYVVETPSSITAQQVLDQMNAEVRRVMIDRMTPEKFILDANAVVVDKDLDGYGFPRRLLRAVFPNDEPLIMVEVTNSTPEPDGTRRLYHLRVDPMAYDGRASTECLAAIASTFRLKREGLPLAFTTPEDYKLEVET